MTTTPSRPQLSRATQTPPDQGRLVVDASFPSSAMFLNGTGPRITIDGVEHEPAWGPSSFDVPPGQHRVRVSSRYFGDTCPAETTVTVLAGQESQLYYKAGMTIFGRGAIGIQPQPVPGMGGFVVLMLVMLIPFVALLVSMNSR